MWNRCFRVDRASVRDRTSLAPLDQHRIRLVSDPSDRTVGTGICIARAKETAMNLTPIQVLALGAIWVLLLAVLSGSIVAWFKWLARSRNSAKPDRIAAWPQATVGFVDILVSFLLLFTLFLIAPVAWRALGLPVSPAKQESKLNAVPPIEVESVASADASDADASKATTSNVDKGRVVKPPVMTQHQFLYTGFAISSQLVCVILMTVFICKRKGCALEKLGWRFDHVAGDLRAGLQCFLMMTPVILILNAILQGLTKTPYEHPIQEMIKQYPWLLGIAFWQAAIVAPVSEEFAFRVLLIGWFESIQFGRDKLSALMFGTSPPSELDTGEPPIDYSPSWWPVLLSGTLFGLAHFNYGVSWVALIVFGVVLGRLYQLRQSIIPVITVHFLFNAMNVTMLGLSISLTEKLGG